MKFMFYGHAAFSLSDGTTTILFDPFFTDNTWDIAKAQDIHCQYIFISHAHFDHYGDAEAIAKANDALIISTAEVAGKAAQAGCRTHGMHLGGKADFPFGSIRLTPAFHGAGVPGGHAAGCIVSFGGKAIYFAGDTALYSDMKLHSRFAPIDCAILPIGDNFTMGIEDAAIAASWIQPKIAIPIHYGTWPLIDKDPQKFKQLTEDKFDVPVTVVAPGSSLEF
jgi:L-ascorbate metabolism protein UlaG (beta-lactamase superfamily)